LNWFHFQGSSKEKLKRNGEKNFPHKNRSIDIEEKSSMSSRILATK